MSVHSLEGRVALVTGAGSGLGKAISLALADAGAKLALVGRGRDKLERTADEIRRGSGTADVFTADIARENEVSRLAGEVKVKFAQIHILVNNAGINVRKRITDFPVEDWKRVIETNLIAPFMVCRALIPLMQGDGYGRIINIASTQAHVALPERTAYAASKAGLLGFTRALSLELASQGITVNSISPGPFATEMNRTILDNPQLYKYFTSRVPLGRWGRLEEIGELVLYLCSAQAGFVTGADIVIDGGWCAQ